MIRYVLADLEQLGAELSRRAAEVAGWLDAAAGRAPPAPPGPGESELAAAIAQVDLACYQALSAAAGRLSSAAASVVACAEAVRTVDGEVAGRICRWAG